MNKKQLTVLWLGVAAELAVLSYSPWVTYHQGMDHTFRRWAWLWQPPSDGKVSLDISILLVESCAVALLFGALIASLATRQKGSLGASTLSASVP